MPHFAYAHQLGAAAEEGSECDWSRGWGWATANVATRPIILVLQLGNTSSAETKFYEFHCQSVCALSVCVCVCLCGMLHVRRAPSSGGHTNNLLHANKRKCNVRLGDARPNGDFDTTYPSPPSTLTCCSTAQLSFALLLMIIQHALYREPYGLCSATAPPLSAPFRCLL